MINTKTESMCIIGEGKPRISEECTKKRKKIMRKNLGKKTFLYPMPVLIIGTYDENGNANAMNAAWGGIYDTNKISVCISPEHKTASNLLKTGAFTVSIAAEEHVTACDYVGIVSGNDVPDKIAKAGFSVTKAEFVNAPVINELPLCLECTVISFDEKTGCTVAEIVNINATESILTDGKVDPAKLKPIIYDSQNHKYLKTGCAVGNAHSDGNKLK